MKHLWNWIDSKSWNPERKNAVFTWVVSVLSCLAGVVVWLLLSPFACGGVEWLLVFAGFPVFGAFIAVFLFTCRHPFCEKLQLTFPALHDRL